MINLIFMMFTQKWLEILEYIFLVGAILGLVAVSLGQSLIYTVISLLFALVLNWFNRYRFQQKIDKKLNTLKSSLHQTQDTLEFEIQRLNSASNLSTNTGTYSNLNNGEFNVDMNSIILALQGLNERQLLLERTLTMIQSEVEMVVQNFNRRPELQQIESLTQVIVDLQQFINQLPNWGNLQHQQLTDLYQKVEEALTQLSERIAALPQEKE